ncbi:Ankyrin-2 [Chionoecetes opilio]|uniref:Ankyrin-2 n=1 Tax=Chionoecetes opilio TaxID=41210 RepID=A0A8J4Y655_CHIOP|nr:Ankyrin-2 [Chionoecetes opilio]
MVTKALHDAQATITQHRYGEENYSNWVFTLTGFEGSESPKKVQGTAWALPLSPEYEETLVISRAVKDGEDLDAIRTIVAEHDGDLKVLVPTPYIHNNTCCLLTLAAWEGRTDLLPLLLGAGLSVEGGGTTVITPLVAAVRRGHADTLKALLSLGADCLATDSVGKFALHFAADNEHEECVAALIPATLVASHNTPQSIVDEDGITPVHTASMKGNWGIIDMLRAGGWSLHAADRHGNTPLHAAARSGSVLLVQKLVAAGMRLDLQNINNEKPLDLAVLLGNHQVEAWILKRQRARQFRRTTNPADIMQLIRQQMSNDRTTYEKYTSALEHLTSLDDLKSLLEVNDPHLVDARGRTILHVLAGKEYINPALLRHVLGHHHTRTYDGHTPLDLVRNATYKGDLKSQRLCLLVQRLESHHQDLQRLSKDYCIIGKNKISDLGVADGCSTITLIYNLRLFSSGGDILRAKRSALTAYNFEQLVFLKGNLGRVLLDKKGRRQGYAEGGEEELEEMQ